MNVAAHTKVYVEPLPSGGYAVKLSGHHRPISKHDTEDEAIEAAAKYQRGLEALAREEQR